jgi:hypothetical protein
MIAFDTWLQSAPAYEHFAGLDQETTEEQAAREAEEELRIDEAMEEGDSFEWSR